MKRVIVTGATGAIGRALLEVLLQNNAECLVLVREGSKRSGAIPVHPLIKTRVCSLDGLSALENDTGRPYDAFFHLAWAGTAGPDRQNLPMQAANIRYALDAAECAARFGCKTFLGVGSQAEYGRVEGVLTAEVPTFPENGYGIAKLCAGQMTRLRAHQLGLRHIWVRVLSVYGPGDGMQSMISSTIAKFLCGEEAPFTKGEQIWDYLYSADAAEALYRLGREGKDGKTYVLGSGEARPLAEYITLLAREMGAEGLVRLGAVPYAEKQVMHLTADISPLTEDVGWRPSVPFEEGIKRTVSALTAELKGAKK